MISFITPIYGDRGISRIDDLIYNVSLYFKDYEHIFCVLDEKEPFKPGQLRNLGFKKSNGDIVAFLDVDMRFIGPINFEEAFMTQGTSFVSWRWITRVNEPKQGIFNKICDPVIGVGTGGCIVTTKQNFINCGGYSNLCIGWKCEDDLFYRRLGRPSRLQLEIYHVEHEREFSSIKVHYESREHNRNMVNKDTHRNTALDSFRQTISDEECSTLSGKNIYKYYLSGIHVPEDYKYMEDYKTMLSFEAG
jgi:glycosyltransferase involved in cell wall biosynthesis